MIYNLCRGASLAGVAGIPPVRDNILRPLLCVAKSDIVCALSQFGIDYVLDSTNDSDDYTRNYIRHNVLPNLERVNSGYLKSFSDFAFSVRADNSYLDSIANEFLLSKGKDALDLSELRLLDYPIFSRVIVAYAKKYGVSLERVHIENIRKAVNSDNFRVSIPNSKVFLAERGFGSICDSKQAFCELDIQLFDGYNSLGEYEGGIFVNHSLDNSSMNVYKFSISTIISSDIINGNMRVRFKKDGDSYRYGGITHKLKKVFNDFGIPPSLRSRIPVIVDDSGVLWVPGLPPRDNGGFIKNGECVKITFVVTDNGGVPIYPATKFDIKKRKDIT